MAIKILEFGSVFCQERDLKLFSVIEDEGELRVGVLFGFFFIGFFIFLRTCCNFEFYLIIKAKPSDNLAISRKCLNKEIPPDL